MKIQPFELERYFAKYEFKIEHLMSASDCEGLYIQELIVMASPQSLDLWNNLKLNYTESAGHPLLRQGIAALYSETTPEQVLVAVPEELIFIAMQNLVNATDHVIAISPTYQSLHSIVESLGCELSLWQLGLHEGEWAIDIPQLESLIKKNTKLIIINFPNNPTGFSPTKKELEEIVQIARKHGITIFSDEMYRLLEFRIEDRLPSISEIYENGIALSGLSKSFALPGLRVGWLTSKNTKMLDQLLEYKDYTTICNSAPSEILAIMALENADGIIERNLEILRQNIEHSKKYFAQVPHLVDWIAPKAGSIAFPKWKGKKPMDQLCESLIIEKGLMIVSGDLFHFANDHFRVGLGRKNYPESLSIFIDHIKSMD